MWAGVEVAEGVVVAEGVMVEVNDDLVEEAEEVEVIEGGVAVVDKAEVGKEMVGVAVVVKEGIAVVVSGVDATGVEAGEVEPPNMNSVPNGIYSKESKQ